MSNRRKQKTKRKGVKKAEERRAQGKTPLYDDGRRYNAYECSRQGGCGGIYLTVDLDPGTTPMFQPCLTTQGCEGIAISLMYPRTPPPKKIPLLVEWYEPDLDVVLHPSLEEHVRKGGLLRRPTEDAPGWVAERLGPVYPRKGERFTQLTLISGGQNEERTTAQEPGDHVHSSGTAESSGEGADPGDSGEGQAAST